MSHRSTGSRLARSTFSVLLVFGARLAFAQEEPSVADIAAARTLGIEGIRLADLGNWEEALDKLARAEKIYHAPTTLGRLGECQIQMGRLVDGTEALRRVARETLAPNAPQVFVNAQERAKAALAKAMPRVAKLKVIVHAPEDVTAAVTIDGKPIAAATIGTDRPIDPGEHVVEATAPRYLKASSKTKLDEGGSGTVELKLEVDSNAVVVAPLPANTTTTPTPPMRAPRETPRNYVPAIVAGVVGGAGVATGVVFGLVALSSKNSLLDSCNGTTKCPPSAKSTYDTTSTEATVSTIGFIVGGLGLAATGILVAVAPTVTTTTAFRVEVGAGSMTIRGRF